MILYIALRENDPRPLADVLFRLQTLLIAVLFTVSLFIAAVEC